MADKSPTELIRIDRATYLERCWLNSKHTKAIHIRKLFDRANEAFVLYDLEPDNGQPFRNTEFFTGGRRQDQNNRSLFRIENRQSRGHQVAH